VVVILSHKPVVSPWERIGLEQCGRVLAKHDQLLVCPKGMPTDQYTNLIPGLQVLEVDPKWMRSYSAYSDFKTSPVLYKALQEKYRFLLCHEPDVFVFRDELDEWCERGFDYIGAPFFSGRPVYPEDAEIIGVGNSGFSLRNVDHHIKANRTLKYLQPPRELWGELLDRPSARQKLTGVPVTVLKTLGVGNNMLYQLRAPYLRARNKIRAEDLFWGLDVARVLPWFRVADPDTAMRFSFEILPHKLYAMTGNQLPFGCHGWFRFGLEFWRPFIEAEGYVLPDEELPAHGSTTA